MRFYWMYLRLHMLSELQYKGWFLRVIQVMIVVITDPIGLILLFGQFGGIGEWSVERILLVYALAVTSFGLSETFGRGLDYFPWHMVRSGAFDRLLLRPRPLLLQVAASYFHIHRSSRVVGGSVAILWCLSRLGVPLSPQNLVILFLALLGGFWAYTGVFVLGAGVAFFTISGLDWIYILTNGSYQVTRCPVEHLPRSFYRAFTFFLPILVISYYPAAAIAGWGEGVIKGLMALPAGLTFFALTTALWALGLSHYQSTGS